MQDQPTSDDPFADDLGTYVGPATTEEALRALADHTPGEWIARLTDPDGKTIYKTGWSWHFIENDEQAVFAVYLRESGAGSPSLAVDAPIVLTFAKHAPSLTAECSLYTGGLTIRFGFGEYAGHTLAMLAWHSVLHETESGDVAPGFGAFVAEVIEEPGKDEER
jgi:hypothetical protein